jgi:hypothetical protein
MFNNLEKGKGREVVVYLGTRLRGFSKDEPVSELTGFRAPNILESIGYPSREVIFDDIHESSRVILKIEKVCFGSEYQRFRDS